MHPLLLLLHPKICCPYMCFFAQYRNQTGHDEVGSAGSRVAFKCGGRCPPRKCSAHQHHTYTLVCGGKLLDNNPAQRTLYTRRNGTPTHHYIVLSNPGTARVAHRIQPAYRASAFSRNVCVCCTHVQPIGNVYELRVRHLFQWAQTACTLVLVSNHCVSKLHVSRTSLQFCTNGD